MSRSSTARKQRRALKSAGVVMMERVTIDGDALAAAASKGASVVDLVAYHVSGALERLDAQGGNILERCAVTIGEHPDFPDGITVEAKVGSRKSGSSDAGA